MTALDLALEGVVTVACRAAGAPVLAGLDLAVDAGTCHGVVGASGAGKTSLVRAVLGRLPLAAGRVRVGPFRPPVPASARAAFAAAVARVPQDAAGSLDPIRTVGWSVVEPLRVQGQLARGRARETAAALLASVGLDPGAADRLPSELSGGQCQRACIARAMSTGPGLVVADEPTSALDPVLQARLLDLLAARRAEAGATLVLVSHSLAVVRAWCDRVTVLHDGVAVESGPVDRVLRDPAHPATRALVAAES